MFKNKPKTLGMSEIIAMFTVTPHRQKHSDNLKQHVHYVDSQITDVTHIVLAAVSPNTSTNVSFKSLHVYVVHDRKIVTFFVALLCLK
jgi:hypothetical protein